MPFILKAQQPELYEAGCLVIKYPGILGRLGSRPVRSVISVGCGSGEEAYSIAMVARSIGLTDLNILGIDVVPENIEAANRAVYPVKAAGGETRRFIDTIPDEYRRYFTQTEDPNCWRIGESVRRMVTFAEGDARVMELSGRQAEVIVCRYLLDNIDMEMQETLERKFREAAPVVVFE